MSHSPYKILHIEPQSWWREIVATTLSRWPEYQLLGSAATAEDGLALALQLETDVVLFEPELPDLDGAAFAAALNGLPMPPRLVLLANPADEATAVWMRHLGVAGFVTKNTRVPEQLPAAIGEIRAGRTFFSAEMRSLLHAPA